MDNLPQLMNRVLELQPSWHKFSSTERFQSEEIIERGTLVTKEAPKLLNFLVSSEKICSVSRYNNRKSNGSNGSGNIAKIPWFRLYEPDFSSSAQDGFYITFLFNSFGKAAYLTLNQASTKGESMIALSDKEVVERVKWARRIVGNEFLQNNRFIENIELDTNKNELGNAFQLTNIASFEYQINNMPTTQQLNEDIDYLLIGLDKIYQAQETGEMAPGDYEAAIEELISFADKGTEKIAKNMKKSSRKKSGGQGIGLNSKEIGAIDKQAMMVAENYYKELGWKVTDKSGVYGGGRDLDCKKDGKTIYVEVKGTTSTNPSSIFLTHREVERSRKDPSKSALLIVSDIQWVQREKYICEGGVVTEIHPWEINDNDLFAERYKYTLK